MEEAERSVSSILTNEVGMEEEEIHDDFFESGAMCLEIVGKGIQHSHAEERNYRLKETQRHLILCN